MPGAKSYAFASTLAATLLAAAALQGCGGTDNGGPSLSADLKPLTAEERADAKNLTTADVAEIAKNRKKVSCIELTMGSLQSFALEVASPEKPAEPNVAATEAPAAATPPATATPATSDQQLIDDEKACHCDRGVAMAGFELYERRENLLKQSKYPEIRNELAAYYPKDDKSSARFLRHGEKISDETLKKLPVVAPRPRADDCGTDCKAARANANAKAKAEGQPEPWPNLEQPKRAACADATATAPAVKAVKPQ